MAEKKEIKQEELEKVAGGKFVGKYTVMRCSNTSCFYTMNWAGVYLNETFDCPKCGQHTFTGIEVGYDFKIR